MLSQTSNWGAKWSRNLTNLLSTEISWNNESNERIMGFRIIIREISYFQNQKNFGLKLCKIEKHYDLKLKINGLKLTKLKLPLDNWSNLTNNPSAAKMGLQFTRIEVNLLDFFLADVRRSRGKFNEIRWKFVINPALIGSQSCLNAGGSQRTQDLAWKYLNSFTIQSRVKRKQESISIFKEDFAWKSLVVWSDGEVDLMATIAQWSWVIN